MKRSRFSLLKIDQEKFISLLVTFEIFKIHRMKRGGNVKQGSCNFSILIRYYYMWCDLM